MATLRELKKRQTRERLLEVARRLFAERGFEAISVVEIAREAQVARATVFNYFPTKEDLVFAGLENFGERLVAAVRDRQAGESALTASRRFMLDFGGFLERIEAGDQQAATRLREISRIIAGSPTLLAREQMAFSEATTALAAALAQNAGAKPDDAAAQAAAHALIGVHRTLVDYVRGRILCDDDLINLAADTRRCGDDAFGVLTHGLGGYAIKP